MTMMITGATGFVGRALLKKYVELGESVVALGRTRPDESDPLLTLGAVTWVQGDITSPSSLKGKFKGIDQVIHAAGRLGAYHISEAEYDLIHVDGTRNVILEAERAGVEKILHVSTCGVQGITGNVPQTEDYPYAPSNPYEYSKAEAERVAFRFAKEGVPIVIARPDFLYGPGDLHVLGLFRAISRGLYFHIDRGQATCVPTYIDDCVIGLMLSLECGQIGQAYNITGPRPISFRQMTDTIADVLGVSRTKISLPKPMATLIATTLEMTVPLVGVTPPLTQNGVDFFANHHQFSYAKALAELNYRPEVDIEDGISRTVTWYQQNGLI